MMRLATIFFLVFFSLNITAQQAINYQQHIDSLVRELNAANNDSVKARRAYDLSEQWGYTDSLKAKNYLEQARKSSGKNKFLNALYIFYYAFYMYDLDADVAMQQYMLANEKLKQFNTKEAYYYRARSWRNYSTIQQRKNDENGMLASITNHAIPLAQRSGNKVLEGELKMLVGLIFMNQNIYYRAIEEYKKALLLIKEADPSSPRLLDTYDNMARAYIFADSLSHADKALQEVRTRLKGLPESTYNLNLYNTESIYFRNLKDYKQAEEALNKGILLAEKLKDSMQVSSMQFNKYKLYFEQGKYNDARNILQAVINGPGVRLIGNKTLYFYEMSETYAKLNDMPNAYKWLKDFFVLWDSSFVEKMRINIVDIETKYQKAEKEKEILALKNQQALDRQQKKINTLIYLLIIGLLASAVAITLLQLRNRKRKEQILKNNILQMEQEKKLSTYEALIDGQEKERNRLATELHDGLGGMLAAVKMNLSKTAQDVAGIHSIIESSTLKLDHSIQELRLIARNLMPPSLRNLGLVNALHDFCEGLKSEAVNIIFQSYDVDESKLDENMKLIIYRIMQELITNAVRHSGGNEILADLVQSSNQIQITVEDNGRGFEQKEIKSVGIGLNNIRSRVDYLKGSMNIESNPGLGTSVTISFNIDDAK